MSWNIRCVLFGHIWKKVGKEWVCQVCGLTKKTGK